MLAQFHGRRAFLSQADIARLTGYPRALARRSLAMLTALGYLTRAPGGSYRLTGAPSQYAFDATTATRRTHRREPGEGHGPRG